MWLLERGNEEALLELELNPGGLLFALLTPGGAPSLLCVVTEGTLLSAKGSNMSPLGKLGSTGEGA